MTLVQAVKTCFRKYVSFSGRAARSEFWKFVLAVLLVSLALIVVNSVVFGPTITEHTIVNPNAPAGTEPARIVHRNYNSGVPGTVFMLATLLPVLAVTWRRMHDIGRAGWVVFVPMAGVVTGIVALVFLFHTEKITGPSGTRYIVPETLGTLFFLAIITAILLPCYWLSLHSQPGPNRYGPNPSEVNP